MPTQGFARVAAVEANHIVTMNRSAHRHGRSKDFLWRIWPSKLSKRSMNGCDELRNLTGSHRMMLEITPDDPGGEMRIDLLGVNVSGFRHYRVLLPHIDGPCWTLLDGLIASVVIHPSAY